MTNKTHTVVTASHLRKGDSIGNFFATVDRVTSFGNGKYLISFIMGDGTPHKVECSKSRKWILLNR